MGKQGEEPLDQPTYGDFERVYPPPEGSSKAETYEKAKKIARPVVRRVADAAADTFGSDCPMAGRMIANGMEEGDAEHPISMVRRAYAI